MGAAATSSLIPTKIKGPRNTLNTRKKVHSHPWFPFHAMRASRETDLLETHPLQVVKRWFGHSPKVAVANYLRVREEHYDQAVNRGSTKPAQIPAHSSHVSVDHRDSALATTLQKTWSEEARLTKTKKKADGEGVTKKRTRPMFFLGFRRFQKTKLPSNLP